MGKAEGGSRDYDAELLEDATSRAQYNPDPLYRAIKKLFLKIVPMRGGGSGTRIFPTINIGVRTQDGKTMPPTDANGFTPVTSPFRDEQLVNEELTASGATSYTKTFSDYSILLWYARAATEAGADTFKIQVKDSSNNLVCTLASAAAVTAVQYPDMTMPAAGDNALITHPFLIPKGYKLIFDGNATNVKRAWYGVKLPEQ